MKPLAGVSLSLFLVGNTERNGCGPKVQLQALEGIKKAISKKRKKDALLEGKIKRATEAELKREMQKEKGKAARGGENREHTKERSATSHCQVSVFPPTTGLPALIRPRPFSVRSQSHTQHRLSSPEVANCSQPFSETGSPDELP
ncbi:hypothetical protein BJX66DRAFT_233854 [Aspergillus keveii]|uniref:Uncharacterized protein n=1 Tax=Aspergillus keveii TaxID=714993 RepID=A0ABR4G1N8_9EURO